MKKKSAPFEKFARKKSNAAIKEQFKQEKRKWKKEKEEFFEKKRSHFSHGVRGTESRGKADPNGNRDGDRNETIKAQTSGLPPTPGSGGRSRHQSSALMPLNKFISHSGISSRRDAAELVKQGKVKVNGEIITEPGHKVSAKDEIKVNGKNVSLVKELVYILLNKPKDYLTTTEDPQNRKTVLDLIRHATRERVYPVGRLDRNTSGVLLLTNDGDLSQQLTHPSHEVKKVYAVTLNRPLEKKDFLQMLEGVKLEDGLVKVDALAYSDPKDRSQIGLEIHSGRNRIVRRIFEHLGYDVKSLDRVMFAGLTKKNVQRGKWRHLSEKEIRNLKFFGKGKR